MQNFDGGAFDAFIDTLYNMVYLATQGSVDAASRVYRAQGPQDFVDYDFIRTTARTSTSLSQVNALIRRLVTAFQELYTRAERTSTAFQDIVAKKFEPREETIPSTVQAQQTQASGVRFPYYAYAPSTYAPLLEIIRGLREGIQERPRYSAEQQRYYEPYVLAGRQLQHAYPYFFPEATQADFRNFNRVLAEYQRGLAAESARLSTLMRSMFAGARFHYVMQQLPDLPQPARQQISQAYTQWIVPRLNQEIAEVQTALSNLTRMYTHTAVAGVSYFSSLRALTQPESTTRLYNIHTVDATGALLQRANQALATLAHLATAPQVHTEAISQLEKATQLFTVNMITSTLTRTRRGTLPQDFLASLENLFSQHSKVQQLREQFNQFVSEFNTLFTEAPQRKQEKTVIFRQEIPAVQRELETVQKEIQTREQRLSYLRSVSTLSQVGSSDEINRIRRELEELYTRRNELLEKRTTLYTRVSTIEEQEKRQATLRTEILPSLSAQLQTTQQQFAQSLRSVLSQAEALTRRRDVPLETRQLLSGYVEQLKQLTHTLGVLQGTERPSLRETYIAPLVSSLRQAGETFGVMNIRNFQIALMFGMSNAIFSALTRIPMEATYRSIQPIVGTVGQVTGLIPFYHEIASFSMQLPRVVADLESRLASMQALLGTRIAAQSAVETAIRIARVQPIHFPEAMEVLTALSVYPSTRLYATTPSFQQQAFNAVQLLSMLAPEQGVGGALFAIREMLGGQFRSLQLRFNISPEVLAAYAGKTVAEFKAAPGAEKIEILSKALESMFGGEEVLFRRGAQFQIQLRNISDTLISAVALPLTSQVQPAFRRIVEELLRVREGTTQPTLATLLPQPQFEALRRVAEERVYYNIRPEQRAQLDTWAMRQAGRELGPAQKISLLLSTDTSQLSQDLRNLRQAIQQAMLPEQMRTIGVQTYGTTTGFLALITTSFNKLIGPLIEALSIHQGISSLVGTFGQRFITHAQQFREELTVATTDTERKQLATRFVTTFVRDLREAVDTVSHVFNRTDVRRLLSPITELMREVALTAFRPVAEVAMLQTIQTAVELPGAFVGGTVSGLISRASTGEIAGSVRDAISNTLGVFSWLALSSLPVWGLQRASAGFLGASMLQYAVQRATPQEAVIMTVLGTGALSYGLGLHQIEPVRNAIVGLRDAISVAIGQSLGSIFRRIPITATRAVGVGGIALGLYEFINFLREYWRETTPSDYTRYTLQNYLAMRGIGAPPEVPESRSRLDTSTWLKGLGAAALAVGSVLALFASGGLAALGAGIAAVGAGTGVVGGIVSAREKEETLQRAVVPTPISVIENIRTYSETAIGEKQTAISRILDQLRTTYRLQTPEFEKYRAEYTKYVLEPMRLSGRISEQIAEAMITGIQKSFLSTQRTQQVVQKIETLQQLPEQQQSLTLAKIYASVFGERRWKYTTDYEKALDVLTLGARIRVEALPEKERPQFTQQFETSMKAFTASLQALMSQYRERQISEGEFRLKTTELVQQRIAPFLPQGETGKIITTDAVSRLVSALQDNAKALRDTSASLRENLTQQFKQVIFPQVASQALATSLYRMGYEAPLTIPEEYFKPEAAQQLRQRILEIGSNLGKMQTSLHQSLFGLGRTAVMIGAVQPQEFFTMQRVYGAQLYRALETGIMPIQQLLKSPQVAMEAFMAMRMAGMPVEQIQEVFRRNYMNMIAQQFKDFSQQTRVLEGLHVDFSFGQRFATVLNNVAQKVSAGGEGVYQALMSAARKIESLTFGVKYQQPEQLQRRITPESVQWEPTLHPYTPAKGYKPEQYIVLQGQKVAFNPEQTPTHFPQPEEFVRNATEILVPSNLDIIRQMSIPETATAVQKSLDTTATAVEKENRISAIIVNKLIAGDALFH